MTTRLSPLDEGLQKHIERRDKVARQLAPLLDEKTLILGRGGSGKTLILTALSYNLREIFGLPIVAIGERNFFRKAFGKHTFISVGNFIEEMKLLKDVANLIGDEDLEDEQRLQEILTFYGIRVHHCVVVMDEVAPLIESRRGQNPQVLLFCEFIAICRHFHITMLLSAPGRRDADRKVQDQIYWFGECSYSKKKRVATIWFNHGFDFWRQSVDGSAYFDMFQSWNIISVSERILQSKKL